MQPISNLENFPSNKYIAKALWYLLPVDFYSNPMEYKYQLMSYHLIKSDVI